MVKLPLADKALLGINGDTMVTRASQALNVQGGGYGEVQQVGQGGVQQSNLNTTVGDGGDAGREATLQAILGTAGKIAEQGIRTSEEDAYLAGQAKAGQIESEELLESSYTTKDWATAGYRDAMGRLKIADAEVALLRDMQELREQGPEAMNAYLAKRRATLTPSLEGMSREQRAAAFGQLLLNDRAAIAKHTIAHVDYQREIQTKTWQATHTTAKAKLDEARRSQDVGVLDNTIKDVASVPVGILLDSRLKPADKESMIVSHVEDMLSSGNVAYYQYLQNVKVPDGKNERGSTVFSRLSLDAQEKLSKANAAAMAKTTEQRNQQRMNDVAMHRNAFKAGTYTGSYDDVVAFAQGNLRQTVDGGLGWSEATYEAFLQDYLDSHRKATDKTGMVDAWARGDHQEIIAKGGTVEQAGKWAVETWGEAGMSTQGIMALAQRAGINGMPNGAKIAGEIASVGLATLADPDGKVLKQHVDTVISINQILDEPKEGDKSLQSIEFLSGLAPEAKQRILSIREDIKRGTDEQQAIMNRLAREKVLGNMTPQQKAMVASRNDKANRDFLDKELGTRDFLDTALSKVLFLSKPRSLKEQILPSDSWILGHSNKSSPVLDKYREQAEGALIEEFNRQYLVEPLTAPDAAHTNAMAEVAARTVKTVHGPLILPVGSTPQKFFGTNDATEVIGRALERTLKTQTDGGVLVFSSANGQIGWQEYSKEGVRTPYAGIIDPSQIRPAVQREVDEKRRITNESAGAGITHVTSTGITLNYSGRNTVSMDERDMLEIKKDLVKFEGVKNTVSKDRGTETTGVGIAFKPWQPKPGPDGLISRADLEASFAHAANESARTGLRIAKEAAKVNPSVNFKSKAATRLLVEMAYQTGPFRDKPGYKEMLSSTTTEDAVKAFRTTGVWADSGPERRKHYEQLIAQTWKGR